MSGQLTVQVCYNDYVGTHRLVVVKGSGPTLLGRDWLSKIRLDRASIKVVGTGDPKGMIESLLMEYSAVFKPESGCLKGQRAHLSLK